MGESINRDLEGSPENRRMIPRIRSFITIVVVFVVFLPDLTSASDGASALSGLHEKLLKKKESVKNNEIISFIGKSVPQGIEAPNPKMAEYETFKSDKSANFVNDGRGHVVFRQFRRARLSDILGHHLKNQF